MESRSAIDRIPPWLRWLAWWIILLLASLWGAGRLELLFDTAFGLTAADRAANAGLGMRILVTKIVSGIGFTCLPAIVSPRPTRVAVALVGVLTLLGSVPVVYRIWMGYVSSQVVIALVAMGADVMGSLLGLAVVKWLVRVSHDIAPLEALRASGASDSRPTNSRASAAVTAESPPRE